MPGPVKARGAAGGNGAPPAEDAEPTWTDWNDGLTLVERRVEEVVTMMLTGNWLPGASDRALAKRWNVHPSRVRHVSAEASRAIKRMIRDDPEYLEERKAQLVTLFSAITQRALGFNNPAGLRCALEAAKATGLYLGLEPPRGLSLMHSTDPFAGMTDEELEAYAAGAKPNDATEH